MIKMIDGKGKNWNVYAPAELHDELSILCVNWYNFKSDDFYYSGSGNKYGVDIEGDKVQLYLA